MSNSPIQMTLSTQAWPIRGAFTISRGRKTQADVVMVTLEQDGKIGRGECVPYARYGESIEQVLEDLNAIHDRLNTLSTSCIQEWLPAGAARNALDCAWWDLQCKQQGNTIWQQLNITPTPLITAYTLSLDTPDKMGLAAQQQQHRPLLKLKLADDNDIDRVAAVRHFAPNAQIIVDANEGWDRAQYQRLIPSLQALNIAMIEQPFPADCDHWLDGLSRPIPLCADESCHDTASLTRLIGRYDLINIKLDKTGGLTEALALQQDALRNGLGIMVGCMVGSSLSMAPAFVVAQQADIVDLDGPLLLAEDYPTGFKYSLSTMQVMSPELWG